LLRVCGAELQPGGGLSLLEPIKRPAGEPMVVDVLLGKMHNRQAQQAASGTARTASIG
jgi:hypothetical protein